MNRKLVISMIYVFFGTVSFTILLLILRDSYSNVFYGMLSGGQIPFQMNEAPIFMWVAFIVAIFLVIKGAMGIGRNLNNKD